MPRRHVSYVCRLAMLICAAAAAHAAMPTRAAQRSLPDRQAGDEAIRGWPQLARNPQRWNYSPEEILPPYRLVWSRRPWDEDPAQRFYAAAQIVVAEGKAYLGAKSGRVWAFDAPTGKTVWTYQAGGPILHTAACDAGKVFFAAMDGCVYALEAATGKLVWQFRSRRRYGFSTAVLLAEAKVFAVDRGGRLFALDPADGKVLWDYDALAPVFQSPAYDAGAVFFGSQDMRVHAVDARSGQRRWRSEQIDGRSLTDFWPVVLGGRVIVRPRTGFEKSTIYDSQVKGLVVLDEATGKEGPLLPHSHAGGWDGPVPPPSVTGDGLLVLGWQVQPGGSFGGCGFVLRDPATGKIVESLVDDSRRGIGARDETMITSVVGAMVIAVHHFGFTGNPGSQSGLWHRGRRTWYPGVSAGARQHGEWTDMGNLNAGGTNAVSAADGLLYHHTLHTVYCFTTRAPDESPKPRAPRRRGDQR